MLDTAEALFARLGYAGLGMKELADRVGIGKSSLFHHFRSKEQLYAAVLERLLGRFDRSLAECDRPALPAPDRLERWVDTAVDLLAENPAYAPLLLRTLFENDVVDAAALVDSDRVIDRIIGRLRDLLETGIAANELRPVSVPHTLQSLIGLSVYHFASGSLGDQLLGHAVFSAAEVDARKTEIKNLLRGGILAAGKANEENETP